MFLFRQPLASAGDEQQPLLPTFAVYFYGLSLLAACLSPVSLEGPLLIGFALLPRANRSPSTLFTPGAGVLLAFLLRVGAGLAGIVKTVLLVIAYWEVLQQALATTVYRQASPVELNVTLGVIVLLAGVFILENAYALVRSFLREWALVNE